MYTNLKSEVNFTRIKLKSECSKAELEEMIEILEQCKTEVEEAYESLQMLTTPLPDIRRKMDTCTSVTSEVIIVLEEWQKESNQIINLFAIKKSLSKLLQRENARSIYGSTVSKLGGSSCQESQISTKKAEVAAHLAAKWAEIHQEDEISMLRERFKKLEYQKDLEAQDNVHVEEEDNDVVEGVKMGNTPYMQVNLQFIPISLAARLSKQLQLQSKLRQSWTWERIHLCKHSRILTKLPTSEPLVFTSNPFNLLSGAPLYRL